jgi:hypothetical protein
MGSHQTLFDNPRAQPPRVGEVGGCIRRAHHGPVGTVAASVQRFTEDFSPLVSGAQWWDHSGALTYNALQPTPWIAVAFLSRLVRRG